MELTPVLCPACGQQAEVVSRQTSYRRGTNVITLEVLRWQCSSGCTVPGTGEPYRFADPQLMRQNDLKARELWREQFDEAMPPPGRPGRKTPEARDHRVPVLLTRSELQLLDQVRGDLSRSAVLRRALDDRTPRVPPLPPMLEEPANAPTRRVPLDVPDVA